MPRRSVSHPLKIMIDVSKLALIGKNNNYYLSVAFCPKSIKFFVVLDRNSLPGNPYFSYPQLMLLILDIGRKKEHYH